MSSSAERSRSPNDRARWQQMGVAGAFVIICLAIGFGSGQFGDSDSDWYVALDKPFYQPPDWLFSPVWTILYIVMAVAAFLVWREGWRRRDVQIALGLFALQLLLNAAWTPIFFGAQSLSGGLVVMLLLLAALAATIWRFFGVRRLAGYLMLPYLAWAVFALLLNLGILLLN